MSKLHRGQLVTFEVGFPESPVRARRERGQIEEIWQDEGFVIVRDLNGEDWSVNIEDVTTV